MRVRIVGLVALMALVLASCGGTTPEAAGPSEGIGVRGAWTIDVLNPDGSLDQRVEFHNEFVGQALLTDLLSMADTMTGWGIQMIPAGGTKICDTGSGNCSVVAISSRDSATDELVVEGSFVPDFDGDVARVAANIVTTSAGNRVFSDKDIASEGPGLTPVGAGQTVQVEVRYSFATLP